MKDLKLKHKSLALWAAKCAKRVLPYFESVYPKDDRPRKAIEAARLWARGKITVGMARSAALAAHAAARKCPHYSAAQFAARAAGHAAGTAHVAGHAPHAANYAVKVTETESIARAEREYMWQSRKLPKRLRQVMKKAALVSLNQPKIIKIL